MLKAAPPYEFPPKKWKREDKTVAEGVTALPRFCQSRLRGEDKTGGDTHSGRSMNGLRLC
jgi:hypothetical protein